MTNDDNKAIALAFTTKTSTATNIEDFACEYENNLHELNSLPPKEPIFSFE